MTAKDFIIISILGLGAFLIARKAFGGIMPESNPDIIEALTNSGLNPNNDELRVMQYADIMLYDGKMQEIAPEIIAAVIRKESSGNAYAKTWEAKVNDYSYGLMQMLPSTAEWMKFTYNWLKYDNNPESLFIPDVSIEIGTKYLRHNLNIYLANPKLNAITDMIASYNAGHAFVNNGIYVNSQGVANVQPYVNTVLLYKSRFRLMFNYLYKNYTNMFPSLYWGN